MGYKKLGLTTLSNPKKETGAGRARLPNDPGGSPKEIREAMVPDVIRPEHAPSRNLARNIAWRAFTAIGSALVLRLFA
jgi:hypothetical protein